ncbi:MAG: hypothetical protein ACP5I4_02900 [Oceanipulchritudo sp.]|jgi:hypothetical protein
MKNTNRFLILLFPCLLLGLAGCGPEPGSQADATPADAASDLILTEVPDSAPGLLEALQEARPGTAILFTGRVGGTLEPFSEGFAGFVVADEVLEFCDEMGDDSHCKTPWDACCEDPGKIAASRAFVQFVDEAGDPLMMDLQESVGLAANDTVVVRGTLSPDSTPENRIILAEGLAVVE